MTVTSIPTAAFRVTADGAQAIAESKRVKDSFKEVNETSLDDVIEQFADLDLSVEGLAKTAAGFIGAGALLGGVKSAIDFGLALGDAADQAGVAVSELSRLNFAAEQNDVSFEALTTGLKKFQEGVSQAAIGGGAAGLALNELGLSAQKLQQLDLQDQLLAVAGAFEQVGRAGDRTRLGLDLFSKSGQEFIQLFADGEQGLRDFIAQADKLGQTLDDSAVASLDRAEKGFGRLVNTIKIATVNVVGTLAAGAIGTGDRVSDIELQIKQLENLAIPARAATNSVFAGLFPNAAGNVRVFEDQIKRLKEELAFIQRAKENSERSQFGLPGELDFGGIPEVDVDDPEARAAKAQEEALKREQQLQDAMIDQRQRFNEQFIEEQERVQAEVSDNVEDELERRARFEQNIRDNNVAREIATQEQLLAFRRAGVSAANALLTAYSGRFAAVGKAILLVEKIMAIKSAFISTREAIMKTLAKYGATPIGYALAAGVAILGAAQIAAIAAQGSGGGSGGSSGGAIGGGTGGISGAGSGSTFDSNNTASDGGGFVNASQPQVAQVIVQGNVFNTREAEEFFINAIREGVDKRDVVIIPANSRQAQEIKSA